MNDNFTSLLASLPDGARMASVRSGITLDAPQIRAAVAARTAALAGSGLRHGDRIVVGEADALDFIIALFAAWEAGLTAVGVNSALSAAEQQNVISTTGARAWLGALRTPMQPLEQSSGARPAPLGIDEPALILMTSGTTGRPKGIVHAQRSLMARIALNIETIGQETLAETLCVLPVFFGHGLIGNGLTPLFASGRVRFWTTPDMTELRGLGAFITTHEIGFMSSVPSFWKIAARVSDKPSRPLARIHIGSAPLSIEQWREIAAWGGTDNVFNMFGMTETANWIAGGPLSAQGAGDGYVGKPWGGTFAIRTDAGEIRTEGRGEVLVKSPSIMLGYWERPDLDAEAFADGWFRTGDTGDLDAEGQLTLVGRIKSEINRGGIKVQAEEVDMLLERHPAIAEACAFGIPDAVAGEAVAAAIVLKPGAHFDAEAIKAWCREQARADAVPSRLYRLDAIPRNDRGKIVRADVRRATEEAK